MPNPHSGMICPVCDRTEGGKSTSELLNKQGGWTCSSVGHKFPNYIALMAMNPRKQKLVVQEKQPPTSTNLSVWIDPVALEALQTRFPSNFRTTIYSLFNALAHPDSILLEGEYCGELKKLGITKGREIIGLAHTNLALAEELKSLQDQMKQYEMISRLLAVAGGGQTNTPAAQAPAIADILTSPAPARPPQQPVQPIVLTESEQVMWQPEPVAVQPGSFSGMVEHGQVQPSGHLAALLQKVRAEGPVS